MELYRSDDQCVSSLPHLTRSWGDRGKVSLYIDKCQVDTPPDLVAATWRHVRKIRKNISLVVDFGAGDGRFAHGGKYENYVGYEIDNSRFFGVTLPAAAVIRNKCAFSEEIDSADLCIGNPPFVRNQDLPVGWRQRASDQIKMQSGVSLSGLANAWQYFFLLALSATKDNGLVALIIPYEWVSRPAAKNLRDHILKERWDVSVYRLGHGLIKADPNSD